MFEWRNPLRLPSLPVNYIFVMLIPSSITALEFNLRLLSLDICRNERCSLSWLCFIMTTTCKANIYLHFTFREVGSSRSKKLRDTHGKNIKWNVTRVGYQLDFPVEHQGCRFVPLYIFGNRDIDGTYCMDENMDFQGLALIQGQIYNPGNTPLTFNRDIENCLKGDTCSYIFQSIIFG